MLPVHNVSICFKLEKICSEHCLQVCIRHTGICIMIACIDKFCKIGWGFVFVCLVFFIPLKIFHSYIHITIISKGLHFLARSTHGFLWVTLDIHLYGHLQGPVTLTTVAISVWQWSCHYKTKVRPARILIFSGNLASTCKVKALYNWVIRANSELQPRMLNGAKGSVPLNLKFAAFQQTASFEYNNWRYFCQYIHII